MPIKLIWRDRGVIFKGSDKFTGAEALDGIRDMYLNPRWPDAKYQIADLTEAIGIEDLHFSPDELVQEGSRGIKLNSTVIKVVVYDKSDEDLNSVVADWFYTGLGIFPKEVQFAKNMHEAKELLKSHSVIF